MLVPFTFKASRTEHRSNLPCSTEYRREGATREICDAIIGVYSGCLRCRGAADDRFYKLLVAYAGCGQVAAASSVLPFSDRFLRPRAPPGLPTYPHTPHFRPGIWRLKEYGRFVRLGATAAPLIVYKRPPEALAAGRVGSLRCNILGWHRVWGGGG